MDINETGLPNSRVRWGRFVINIGYDPLVDDLGDDTGEGHLPGIPEGVQVNIYDPTRPGLGDDTGPVQARRVLVVNISAELMRSVFS